MAVVVASSIDGLIRTPRPPQLFDSRNDSAPHDGAGDITGFQELIRTPSGIEAGLVAVPVNYQPGRPIDVAIGGHAAIQIKPGVLTFRTGRAHGSWGCWIFG